jgi:hypothetical protein
MGQMAMKEQKVAILYAVRKQAHHNHTHPYDLKFSVSSISLLPLLQVSRDMYHETAHVNSREAGYGISKHAFLAGNTSSTMEACCVEASIALLWVLDKQCTLATSVLEVI